MDEDAAPTTVADLDTVFDDIDLTNGDPSVLQTLSYSVVNNSNPDLASASIDGDGVLLVSYTGEHNGSAEITVGADDSNGSTLDESFTVTVNAVNDLPILSAIGDQEIMEDEDFSIDLSASDIDIETNDQILEFSAESSDESLVTVSTTTEVNGTTGTLTFDVQSEQNGFADITVTVTDSEGAIDSEIFMLTVNAVNDEPILMEIGDQVSDCLLYTSPSPRDQRGSRMPSSA